KNLNKIRRRVSFLFDYPDHQLFSTTVYQDIKFGLDNYKIPDRDKRINKVACDLEIDHLLGCQPYQLSLGQKKKVAIAGLLVLKSDIILCDEPFAGLDSYTMEYFKNLLDDLVEEGKTIIFSTHDVDLTYEWAENVVILREGQVLAKGPTLDVLGNESFYVESGLKKPMLYELFEDSQSRPRNLQEARDCLYKNNS